MTTKAAKEIQAHAMRDQAWAGLRNAHEAIDRIAWNGPDESREDHVLIRRVFLIVAGDLEMRAAEAAKDEV